MVLTMEVKNVILRGRTYHFRLRVPGDCIQKTGRKEISQSLKTGDPAEAAIAAKKLEQVWAAEFKAIRSSAAPVPAKRSAVPDRNAEAFRQQLINQAEKTLPDIFEQETDKQLLERFNFYADAINIIQTNSRMGLELDEIGIHWPLKPSGSARQDRLRRRVLIEVLEMLRKNIGSEMVNPPVQQETKPHKETAKAPAVPRKSTDACPEEHDILEVADLMLAAKKRIAKTQQTVKADIRLLTEWTGGKRDITAYTKKELIDFIQNCLPHLPANMARRGNQYAGKTLRQCIDLTKTDPEHCPPISHTTCGNRLVNITMVFNYAKDHLGIIPVNPARGIEIPAVNVSRNLPRGFTPDELTAMWTALEAVKEDVARKPSHYWTTVLSLYHGFRLNEACGLFIKDVYEDEDGVFVMDINADGPFKSVKNRSSVRIVPVHPFVRDRLGFREFFEEQKQIRTDGVLFHDVRGNAVKGYRDRMTRWFAKWKQNWLPEESLHKHFHDLRYTFIRTAQNDAKMSDRCSQEITGHSVSEVSAVHLGYSGRLKPAAVLEELQKIRYGWE